MGLTEFSITVNQNKLIYLPGETVYGQVNVRLNGSMKMSGRNLLWSSVSLLIKYSMGCCKIMIFF